EENYKLNNEIDKLNKEIDKLNKEIEKLEKFDFNNEMEEIGNLLDNSKEGIRYTAFGDEDFPECRFERIENKNDLPVFFAYEGDLKLLSKNNFNIAVIGILEPTEEIKQLEKEILGEILKYDATIISGLALGCDTIAHKSVSDQNCTIAILPSTLDNILPKENRELASEIVRNKNGLLISEYYKEAENKFEYINRYIKRDRLQALFSDMVILTASYSEKDSKKDKKKDSGSRHAMGKAKDYGIKRAVMYDEAIFDDEKFNLNRELIAMKMSIAKLDEQAIMEFNKSDKSKDFKIITKRNVKFIIGSLKKWKEKISTEKPKIKGEQPSLPNLENL
ncbi:DNA-processing protein DprA, partial [uncultured Helicobacter sp.]|uniref:DNA-processing protein DprA n=1 Tax=uncultured Helicobacter sp. TaxID=175537 RepID=UPI0026137C64